MRFEKEEHLQHAPTAHVVGLTMPPEKHISPGKLMVVVLVAIAIVAGVVYTGIRPRMNAMAALTSETNDLAAPTVALVKPQLGAPAQEIVLPGSIEAFI